MSISTLHDTLCDIIESGKLGFVDRNRGRSVQAPWWRLEIQPLWVVSLYSSSYASSTLQTHTLERVYQVDGYYPHNYDLKSDETWLDYLSKLEALISEQPRLPGCLRTFPPSVIRNDIVEFLGMLCHNGVVHVRVLEVVENA